MTQTIDAAAFQQMVIHAAASINAEKQQINDLNVFPVPDGDTGTNMSLTIGAAATELKKNQYATVGLAAKAAASALLRGARGNSGVILSLLFRGFAKGIKECETMRRPGSGHCAGLRRGRRLQGRYEARRGHHPHRVPHGGRPCCRCCPGG